MKKNLPKKECRKGRRKALYLSIRTIRRVTNHVDNRTIGQLFILQWQLFEILCMCARFLGNLSARRIYRIIIRGFPQPFIWQCRDRTQNKTRPLPSKLAPIHQYFVILSFDVLRLSKMTS